MTQKDLVKKHLNTGRPLTSWEAIQKRNCTRLAAVIGKLKDEGMKIKSTLKTNPETGKSFAEYEALEPVKDKSQILLF